MRTGHRWGRYTPTETCWLSVVALGGAILLAALWLVVDAHPDSTVDRRAFLLLSLHRGPFSLNNQHYIEAAAISLLAAITLVALVSLSSRRRWIDAAGIILGFVLVGPAADAAKSLAQRIRPAHSLIFTSGYSFPSSDSAISLGLLAVAYALLRLSGQPRRRVVLMAIVAPIIAVGDLGFVALRVHFLTDVIAGWSLGALIFAACALAVDRIALRVQRRRSTG